VKSDTDSPDDPHRDVYERIDAIVHESLNAKVVFFANHTREVERASRLIADALRAGHKLLLFGNGGSACDAQHIAGELVNIFLNKNRKALPAISLATDGSILTSIANDSSFIHVFERQVQALGRRGDVAIGITTSGNSPNVVLGLEAARYQNMHTIGLLGRDGGRAADLVDIALTVGHEETARIQETHILIGHIICHLVEEELFGEREATTASRA
jgi:D-sedoheptulose 7-phosphate isomerase